MDDTISPEEWRQMDWLHKEHQLPYTVLHTYRELALLSGIGPDGLSVKREELAARRGLKVRAIDNHLRMLRDAGLIPDSAGRHAARAPVEPAPPTSQEPGPAAPFDDHRVDRLIGVIERELSVDLAELVRAVITSVAVTTIRHLGHEGAIALAPSMAVDNSPAEPKPVDNSPAGRAPVDNSSPDAVPVDNFSDGVIAPNKASSDLQNEAQSAISPSSTVLHVYGVISESLQHDAAHAGSAGERAFGPCITLDNLQPACRARPDDDQEVQCTAEPAGNCMAPGWLAANVDSDQGQVQRTDWRVQRTEWHAPSQKWLTAGQSWPDTGQSGTKSRPIPLLEDEEEEEEDKPFRPADAGSLPEGAGQMQAKGICAVAASDMRMGAWAHSATPPQDVGVAHVPCKAATVDAAHIATSPPVPPSAGSAAPPRTRLARRLAHGRSASLAPANPRSEARPSPPDDPPPWLDDAPWPEDAAAPPPPPRETWAQRIAAAMGLRRVPGAPLDANEPGAAMTDPRPVTSVAPAAQPPGLLPHDLAESTAPPPAAAPPSEQPLEPLAPPVWTLFKAQVQARLGEDVALLLRSAQPVGLTDDELTISVASRHTARSLELRAGTLVEAAHAVLGRPLAVRVIIAPYSSPRPAHAPTLAARRD